MTGTAAPPGPSLACEEILRRTLRKQWLSRLRPGKPDPAAFVLHPGEEGLSVDRACLCTVEQSIGRLNNAAGVATLHTGCVRDIENLDVLERAHAGNPAHALIVGLPEPVDGDTDSQLRAELVARALAEHARIP